MSGVEAPDGSHHGDVPPASTPTSTPAKKSFTKEELIEILQKLKAKTQEAEEKYEKQKEAKNKAIALLQALQTKMEELKSQHGKELETQKHERAESETKLQNELDKQKDKAHKAVALLQALQAKMEEMKGQHQRELSAATPAAAAAPASPLAASSSPNASDKAGITEQQRREHDELLQKTIAERDELLARVQTLSKECEAIRAAAAKQLREHEVSTDLVFSL